MRLKYLFFKNSFRIINYRMSASDYTHLRRVRHVYQPSVTSHHHNLNYGHPYSHHHVSAPMHMPMPMPYPHQHYVPPPTMMPPPPQYPSSCCTPPVHHHDPYGYHYQHPLYLGTYPYVQPPQPHYHNGETVVVHSHPSTCHHLPTVVDSHHDHHDDHHHHPAHHLDHHHDSAYEHGHDLGLRHGNTYIHNHGESVVEHHHHHFTGNRGRASGPSSSTRYQYLISPAVNGSVTFTIDPNLNFTKDMRISVTSDLSSNNYFEGNVYTYNPCNGEITIYKIATVNGTFNKPSRYTISFGTSVQEFDKLKLRTAELELKVFGSTNLDPSGNVIPDPSGNLTSTELTKADTDIKNLYKYFFNENIEDEEDYVKTEGYLTLKINTLYNYFFDVNILTNTAFNPNNNGVELNTLPKKIGQLNYYFFGNINPTLNV